MKKETKKQIATNLLLALFVGVFTCIAIKCGRMNQEKEQKESPNNYEAPKVDKVSSTTNQSKLDWLESVYNYKLNNEKP